MRSQPLLYGFVVSLALSAAASAVQAQTEFTEEGFAAAISRLQESPTEIRKCNPFIDAGCNTPTVPTPKGCTDCNNNDLADLLRAQDGMILLPNSVNIDGANIMLNRELNDTTLDEIWLAPQVGF